MTADAIASEFAQYVIESPTAFHAAAVARDRLVEAGFTVLSELDAWPTDPGAYENQTWDFLFADGFER